MYICGRVRIGARTKELVTRIKAKDIAVIDHQDLDEVAARALISSGVSAVINASPSISGKYPNPGPGALVNAGIPLVDNVGEEMMYKVQDGEEITIQENGCVYKGSEKIASGNLLDGEAVRRKLEESQYSYVVELERFVRNTVSYAVDEVHLITRGLKIPPLKVDVEGKHVLVVVRGKNYREDLQAIRSYIREVQPVLIGVDGGADALLDFGYRPDIIIGDMDSVSDRALAGGAQLIVHAYPDGKAPGARRVEKLGFTASVLPATGTSEDVAMLLAYERGAELIVAVGTHSSVIDFLEKGRRGMASTFLTRMKIGSVLVDAKGVSKLYKQDVKPRYLIEIVLAALIPLGIAFIVSPFTFQLFRLLLMKFKLFLTQV